MFGREDHGNNVNRQDGTTLLLFDDETEAETPEGHPGY